MPWCNFFYGSTFSRAVRTLARGSCKRVPFISFLNIMLYFDEQGCI